MWQLNFHEICATEQPPTTQISLLPINLSSKQAQGEKSELPAEKTLFDSGTFFNNSYSNSWFCFHKQRQAELFQTQTGSQTSFDQPDLRIPAKEDQRPLQISCPPKQLTATWWFNLQLTEDAELSGQ